MDQQNYELDQTGAEETPKKKKGSTVKGIVIGVIGTLLISWIIMMTLKMRNCRMDCIQV